MRTRGGGRAVGGLLCKSDGGRFYAKCPKNRNFVFLVDKYFGTQGVLCNKFERICCSKRTSLDPERVKGKLEGLFATFHTPLAGYWPLDRRDLTNPNS
jgi:hypothetical protein